MTTEPDADDSHRRVVEAHTAVATTAWVESVFGSIGFFRLWIVQLVSATGDWLGFLAIVAAATRVGGGSPEAAVGLVVSARIIPGLFFAPVAGMLVDRWNRKHILITCDLARAAIMLYLPFVDQVWQLVLASLALEAFTLLWSPAKESIVPDLVPKHMLTRANSLSFAAAYGTFPIAAGMFWALGRAAAGMADWPGAENLRIDQEALAFYVDAVTFTVAALLIWTIHIHVRSRDERSRSVAGGDIDSLQAFHELREGWRFIFINPIVRAVMVALATGLIGGGMLIPLGPVFAQEVLGEDPAAGYAFLQTALGMGVAVGVLALSITQKHIRKMRLFVLSVFGSGLSLMLAASMTRSWAAASLVGLLGVFAGAIYILGFTLLHEHVDKDLRGRIFGALHTIVRLCLIIALSLGPFMAALLDGMSDQFFDGRIDVFGTEVFIPGVRLTLWLASLIMFAAAVLALVSVRSMRSSAPEGAIVDEGATSG
ncbi:MAG: MFS transporter [Acidimicrobiia bacterium]|nr:MFS transporter [Acidimicrobiia bacterium]